MNDNLKYLIAGALLAGAAFAAGVWFGQTAKTDNSVDFVLSLLSEERVRHQQTIKIANERIEELARAATPEQ